MFILRQYDVYGSKNRSNAHFGGITPNVTLQHRNMKKKKKQAKSRLSSYIFESLGSLDPILTKIFAEYELI